MAGVLRLWFGVEARVTRRAYAATGLGLMAFKYAVESAIVRRVTGSTWTLGEYFNPFFSGRAEALAGAPDALTWFLFAWSLPFVWIGVSMTFRRAIDAGLTPWTAVTFFLPGLNYVVMFLLAVRPSREGAHAAKSLPEALGRAAPALSVDRDIDLVATVRRIFAAAALSTLCALAMVGLSVYALRAYNAALFAGAPFVMGAVGAYWFNRQQLHSFGANVQLGFTSLLFFGGAMVLFALEGIVCLGMAAPLAAVLLVPGAVLGRTIAAIGGTPPSHAALSLLALPAMAGLEELAAPTMRGATVTAIEVEAPPEVVWEHVVAFPRLPEPSRLPFLLGVAHPVGARIEGRGVGAVRRCEFSTGAFVEPITAWEPPHRLAFDVVEQPPPMRELSIWANVDAPHLHDTVRCLRGEFRLVRLPGGRTRLEGATWYELDLRPHLYWKVPTDLLLHAIHRRVLEHVKRQAEDARAGER